VLRQHLSIVPRAPRHDVDHSSRRSLVQKLVKVSRDQRILIPKATATTVFPRQSVAAAIVKKTEQRSSAIPKADHSTVPHLFNSFIAIETLRIGGVCTGPVKLSAPPHRKTGPLHLRCTSSAACFSSPPPTAQPSQSLAALRQIFRDLIKHLRPVMRRGHLAHASRLARPLRPRCERSLSVPIAAIRPALALLATKRDAVSRIRRRETFFRRYKVSRWRIDPSSGFATSA